MKNTKLYENVAKTAAELQKEIMNYAEDMRVAFMAEKALVDITGFDVNKDQMTADINLKQILSTGNYGYVTMKCVAYKGYSRCGVNVIDTETFIKYPGQTDSRLSFAAVQTAFCN